MSESSYNRINMVNKLRLAFILIERFYAFDQTSSKCASKKVAEQFQCFCIELNKSDLTFFAN